MRGREARRQWTEAVAVLLGWMNFIRQGTGQFPEIGSPENGGQGTSGLAWLLEMHPTMGNEWKETMRVGMKKAECKSIATANTRDGCVLYLSRPPLSM